MRKNGRVIGPLIGVLMDGSSTFGRNVYRGILEYARAHTDWRFYLHLQPTKAFEFAYFTAQGLIGELGTSELSASAKAWGGPVVNVSGWLADARVASVRTDDWRIGRLGAEHLMGRGFASYAFHGEPTRDYVRGRLAGFEAELTGAGVSVAVIPRPSNRASQAEWDAYWDRLPDLLGELPKPLGMMAGNDLEAFELAQLCEEQGLAIPEEVAILGVDNDPLLTASAVTPLSSVDTDLRAVGRQAAMLLDRLLAGREPVVREVRVPPRGVVARQSTDVLAIDDPLLAGAIRYVRERACDPCSVADVLRVTPVSRRSLELGFRRVLGRSPLAEINRVRMAQARMLLGETDVPVADVSARCGFAYQQSFSHFFRKHAGVSPARYRQASRAVRR